MQIDLFNEIQNPKPWTARHEQRSFQQAIEQAKLADDLGYGCWWQVEHHGADEFSLSSAPELLLAAISQQTTRIRLGHAAVLAPMTFNHPIRIAERAATLDHLSNGRLELGLTKSTIPEWRLFGANPDEVRPQTQQAFEMIHKMWTTDRFTYHSDTVNINDVRIAPKPLQDPHPPLWQAAASPASFEEAGQRGVGVLGTTMWESLERAGRMIDLHRAAANKCTKPVGSFVNNQVAFFTFVHCALRFFEAAELFVLQTKRHQELLNNADRGGLTGDFLRAEADNAPSEAQMLIGRVIEGEDVPPEEVFTILSAQDSLIVGSPETCRRKLKAYADLGIDRMMCLQQMGGIPHKEVMKSIELIGDLIPDLAG